MPPRPTGLSSADAQDDFQLISYDSSLGSSGDWKTTGTVKDVSGTKCAAASG